MDRVLFKYLSEERQYEIVHDLMPEDWYEWLEKEISKELEEYGFEDSRIAFDLSHSQGSGASFTCNGIDVNSFYNKIKTEDFDFQFRNPGIEADEDDIFMMENLGIDTQNPIESLLTNSFWYGKVIRSKSRYYHERSTSLDLECESYFVVNSGEEDYENFEITEETEVEIEHFHQYIRNYIDRWMENKNSEIHSRLDKEWKGWIKGEIEDLTENSELKWAP
jgi:hypothetical protein